MAVFISLKASSHLSSHLNLSTFLSTFRIGQIFLVNLAENVCLPTFALPSGWLGSSWMIL